MQQRNKEYSLLSIRRNYKQPHEQYDKLRKHDEIYFDQTSQCWLVTSHAAATKILGDLRFTSRLGKDSISPITSVNKQMLFKDGDEHKRAQDAFIDEEDLVANCMMIFAAGIYFLPCSPSLLNVKDFLWRNAGRSY